MRTPRRPHRLLTPVLALLLLALTACNEEVEYHPPVGVSNTTGVIKALSLTVVTNCHGAATLVGTLFNEGTDTDLLLDVTATPPYSDNPNEGTPDPVVAAVRGGAVLLPPRVPVQLAERSAVTLTSSDFAEGTTLEITLSFAQAPPTRMIVLIYPQEGIFDEVPVPHPPGVVAVPGTVWCGLT